MIFAGTHDLVLSGAKTETRRIMRKGDDVSWVHPGPTDPLNAEPYILSVRCNGRLLYWDGQTYAVQPGRGKPALGHIKLLLIRREPLQDITAKGCIAEGMTTTLREQDAVEDLRRQYQELWDHIHRLAHEKWASNPMVWVLTFALVRPL